MGALANAAPVPQTRFPPFTITQSGPLRRAIRIFAFVPFLVLSYPFCLSLESLEAFRSAKCGLARDSETRNAGSKTSIIQAPVQSTKNDPYRTSKTTKKTNQSFCFYCLANTSISTV